MNNTRNRVI